MSEKKIVKTADEITMNLEGITKLYNTPNGLNLPLLKEATRQVELKVHHENDRKERIDTRVYTLMTILLGLLGVVFGSIALEYIKYPWILGLTAFLFVGAILHLLQTLKPMPYAESGTLPIAWICESYFQGNEAKEENEGVLGFALANRLIAQVPIINLSVDSNSKRLIFLNRALSIMQCSMISIFVSLLSEIYIIL
jgi:hypothetical protein